MHFYAPVSMSGLNKNIDAELIFNNIFSTIRKVDNGGELQLFGGSNITGGARIDLTGLSLGGDMLFSCPDNVGGFLTVFTCEGNVAVPYMRLGSNIDANSKSIYNLIDPVNAQDALTHHAWADWTPTITWITGTPSGITTVARWVQIGKTVFFRIHISSADSNGCTDVNITLPVMPANTASYTHVAAREQYGPAGLTYASLSFFITQSGAENHLYTNSFYAGTDNQAIRIMMAGQYEVA